MLYESHFSPPPLEVVSLALGDFQTNCYLVSHPPDKGALIIDPAESADIILARCEALGVRPAMVLLTHGHCDHVNAAGALAAEGAPILVHGADAEKLGDPMQSGAAYFGFQQEVCQATRLLQEGDVVDLWEGAAPLRVMHTPGHSPGSICLVRVGCAFVGDVLFAGGIGRTDFFDGSDQEMTQSLERLLQLPDETLVFPGHGPATTIGDERASNPFLPSR